ncbi:MAG: DNA methylase [Syntrophorhabdus sp. PtaU1.Bin153]|nr:MAG: DNA methylase [Syntrophorhabdus sp. PtaU1.Bin153]
MIYMASTKIDPVKTVMESTFQIIKSVSADQTEIISDIMKLHLSGRSFDLDPTYSSGAFYKNLSRPAHVYDLNPQKPEIQKADVRNLPLRSSSISSAMFDPPFLVGCTFETSRMGKRFGGFKNWPDFFDFISRSLTELYRVLKSGGVLVVKCQDIVNGRKQHLSHVFIVNKATEIGFLPIDIFISVREQVIIQSALKNQQHARKTHSYFIVFRKESSGKRMKRIQGRLF